MKPCIAEGHLFFAFVCALEVEINQHPHIIFAYNPVCTGFDSY